MSRADALLAMDRDSNRCAVELADAQCDAMAYACLVAIMAAGAWRTRRRRRPPEQRCA